MKPDAVFVATGGILTVPEVQGVKSKNVMTTPELHHRVKPLLKFFGPKVLGWATKYYLPMGKTVVVIGSGLHGCETAEFLTKRGRKVTIVEPTAKIGEGVLDFRLGLTMEWFGKQGVNIVTNARDMVITEKGLSFTDKDGKKQTIEADSVVPTSPLLPNAELMKGLEGKVPELYVIGDARNPRMIVNAIRDGYQAASKV